MVMPLYKRAKVRKRRKAVYIGLFKLWGAFVGGTMRKIYPKTAHGLGSEKTTETAFSKNHFASLAAYPAEVREQIASWGLTRVAGNSFICESSRDFWQVKDGKIRKLVGNEVDDGDKIAAAPDDQPAQFIAGLLSDLEF